MRCFRSANSSSSPARIVPPWLCASRVALEHAWPHAGEDMPMLVGNLVAILASALVCVVVSLIKPDHYDWKSTREISMVDDAETGAPRDPPACGWRRSHSVSVLSLVRLSWQVAMRNRWAMCA